MSTITDRCPHCGGSLSTPAERESICCIPCALFPPRDDVPAVSEDVLLAILRKGFIAGKEAAFRERANGSTWAASAGYSVAHDLGADPDPPEDDEEDEPVNCHSCGHPIKPHQRTEYDGAGRPWHRGCRQETYDGSESTLDFYR